MISILLVNYGVDVLLIEWRQPQIKLLNKITFSKNEGQLQKASINVADACSTGTERDPAPTDAGAYTKVVGNTTKEM